jgi:tRNA G18 (ribose-2'-O)-methylase SpoU
MIEQITSPDDPRVAPYREVKEKDLVGRQGLFMAEGEVVLRRLIGAPKMETVSVLVAEKRLDKLGDALAKLPPTTPVYVATPDVLDVVAGFPLHRGMLAIGRRRATPDAGPLLASLPKDALVLVLVGIANHDNMGGLFRNAAAFGVDAVLLDATSCDPLYRKAIRVSVGAALTTPFARISPDEDLITLLTDQGFTPLALTPKGATPLAELTRPGRAAVILGAEGPGLPQGLIDRAAPVAIPMANDFDSLNVAVTAGIVLHHLSSAPQRKDP